MKFLHFVFLNIIGSVEGTLKNVKVTGCDSLPVCQLKSGSNYTVSIDFVPKEQIAKATTVVHGVVAGVDVPFPIDNPNACKDSGLSCPVASGAAVSYHSSIYVKPIYPKIKVIVKWELKDQNNKDLICIKIPVAITEAEKPKSKPSLLNKVLKDSSLRFKPHH